MTAGWRLLGLLPVAACAPVLDAAWAIDVIRWEPAAAGAAFGLQTWMYFDPTWERTQAPSREICAALVALDGVRVEAADASCVQCGPIWQVTPRRLEDDCPDGLLQGQGPLLRAITGLAFGRRDASLGELPVSGVPEAETLGVWAQRNAGAWEPFGWAWPEGAASGAEDFGDWDGERPFHLEPAFAWDLRGGDVAPTTTRMSR